MPSVLQVKMESLAHEYGQRVLPHFASFNAHDIKASQDAALKYSLQTQEQDLQTTAHNEARVAFSKQRLQNIENEIFLQQKERELDLQDRAIRDREWDSERDRVVVKLENRGAERDKEIDLERERERDREMRPKHEIRNVLPLIPSSQHLSQHHPHFLSQPPLSHHNGHHLTTSHHLHTRDEDVHLASHSPWPFVYMHQQESQQSSHQSYRDREPLSSTSSCEDDRGRRTSSSSGSHISPVYSSNPEIRVCSPRGRSASPVINRRGRDFSPSDRSSSPPMKAMNLVVTSISSSSSSSPTASTPAPLPSSSTPPLASSLPSSSSHHHSSKSIPSSSSTDCSSSFKITTVDLVHVTSPSSSSSSSLSSSSSGPAKPKPSPITLGVPPLSSLPGGSSPLTPASSHMPIISPTAKHPMAAFHGIPTPLFLHSPMVGPLHFWSSLSPVTTLSPRLSSSGSAFQFPSFFNSPLGYSPLVGNFTTSSAVKMENLGTPGLVSSSTRTISVL